MATLENLAADPALARKLFGPRGSQVIALLTMVRTDSQRDQFEACARRWNQAGIERHKAHYQAAESTWAGAHGGVRRGWLLNIDRCVVAHPHDGPWRDTDAQILLADACCGEAARSWIGDAAAALLVRDWFYAWLGAT